MLETNLVKAVEAASRQRKVAEDFTATFPHETVQRWRKMVKEWQADPSRPNPYISNERGTSFQRYFAAISHGFLTSIENLRGSTAADSRRGC